MTSAMEEGQAWTLERIHSVHPWPAGWREKGAVAEVLWTFDLEIERERLWPHVIDTSAINRALDLAPIAFTEMEGQLHAEMGRGFAHAVWDEPPWQWEYARWLSYDRIHSKGMAHTIRMLNLFEEPSPGKTRMIAYTGAVTTGWLTRTLFLAYMNRLRPKYERLLMQMVELEGRGLALGRQPKAEATSAEGRERAERIRDALLKRELDPNAIEALFRHVLEGDELELHRIRPRALARRVGLDEAVLLELCLAASHEGLLTMRWDVVCPHCRGVRSEMEHLGKVPLHGECAPCGIDFETSRADVMEISFRIHPQIRAIADRVFCAAEPATKTHIRLQRTVQPGDRTVASTLLRTGHYRARLIGSKDREAWTLTDDAAPARVTWRASEGNIAAIVRAKPEIELINDTSEPHTFVLEQSEADSDALRPRDVFGLSTFREEFADEAIAIGVALDVGVQTILFTDVVGSTRFYLDAGDTVAFAEVRRKFVIAWEIVESCEGAVVKTIGDAVMAAFKSASQALDAAVKMQRAFDGQGECKLRIRVTLHTGPCLAVNLNTGVDYFGTTVNLAAKIQSMAGAGEIAWTESVQGDPEVAKALAAAGFVPESMPFRLASSDAEQTIYRIKVE